MKYKLVFCFSGQGSHYYHMARELYNDNPTFKSWMNRLDEIARPLVNESVISALYDEKVKKTDLFDKTALTHPAIFMTQYSLYRVFAEKKSVPDYFFGSSLGEYAAIAASGILDYEDALKLVIKQAEIIEATCMKGCMTAVLAPTDLFRYIHNQVADIELSSINSDNHFIISGNESSMNKSEEILNQKDAVYLRLNVSHAFHSSLIDPSYEQFKQYVNTLRFKEPEIPYMSCITRETATEKNYTQPDYYWDICRKPMNVKEATDNLEKKSPYIYVDLGPSGTMINLIKQNIRSGSGSIVCPVLTMFGKDSAGIVKAEDIIKKYSIE